MIKITRYLFKNLVSKSKFCFRYNFYKSHLDMRNKCNGKYMNSFQGTLSYLIIYVMRNSSKNRVANASIGIIFGSLQLNFVETNRNSLLRIAVSG